MKQIFFIDNESYHELIQKIEKIDRKISAMQAENTANRWLTNKEVSEMLSVTGRTLQNYRDSGILPFSQVGSKIYYREDDIQEFLLNHYQPKFGTERRGE